LSGVSGLNGGGELSGVVGLNGLDGGGELSGVVGLNGLDGGGELSGVVGLNGLDGGGELSGVVGVFVFILDWDFLDFFLLEEKSIIYYQYYLTGIK